MKLRPLSRLFGIILLADGVAALNAPREYTRGLEKGTPIVDDLLELLADNPDLVRKFSMLEIVAGLYLTLRP